MSNTTSPSAARHRVPALAVAAIRHLTPCHSGTCPPQLMPPASTHCHQPRSSVWGHEKAQHPLQPSRGLRGGDLVDQIRANLGRAAGFLPEHGISDRLGFIVAETSPLVLHYFRTVSFRSGNPGGMPRGVDNREERNPPTLHWSRGWTGTVRSTRSALPLPALHRVQPHEVELPWRLPPQRLGVARGTNIGGRTRHGYTQSSTEFV